MSSNLTPEQRFGDLIDQQVRQTAWSVVDRDSIDLVSYQGAAVREVIMDDSLSDAANLLASEIIAREIMENLESVLTEFAAIVEALEAGKNE